MSTRTGPRWRAIGPHSSTGASTPCAVQRSARSSMVMSRRSAARRADNAALVDGERDHLDEGLGEQRRRRHFADMRRVHCCAGRVRNGSRRSPVEPPERDQPPFQRRGGDLQRIRRCVQRARPASPLASGAQSPSARARASASARRRRSCWRAARPGLLLLSVDLLDVLGRHRVPGEDVEQLVREVEVAAAGAPRAD